jgi:hypothetical protein
VLAGQFLFLLVVQSFLYVLLIYLSVFYNGANLLSKDNLDEFIYFKEYFSGIKDSSIARFYTFIFLSKRLLMCFIVIVGSFAPQIARISVFLTIQII